MNHAISSYHVIICIYILNAVEFIYLCVLCILCNQIYYQRRQKADQASDSAVDGWIFLGKQFYQLMDLHVEDIDVLYTTLRCRATTLLWGCVVIRGLMGRPICCIVSVALGTSFSEQTVIRNKFSKLFFLNKLSSYTRGCRERVCGQPKSLTVKHFYAVKT